MKLAIRISICLLVGLAMASTCSGASQAGYDPAADPAADLRGAIEKAEAENKRILLEIGGEWCSWCHILHRFIAKHPRVSEQLEAGFVVLKVNYSNENRNEDFLSRYPRISGYPHLFVLEKDGSFLHSQSTGDLEEGKGYSEDRLLEFLQAWSPGGDNSPTSAGALPADSAEPNP